MTLSYFDTSILLAILLEEERQEEAQEYWQNSIRVSSILLKIEAIVGLRRIYESNKQRLKNGWLNKKLKILDEYFNEVNYMVLDHRVEQEIYIQKELAQCRALDAVHIATALLFKALNNEGETNLYTFDKSMYSLAKHYGFKTNKI
jgi:predicted nucleic acid-binding protein